MALRIARRASTRRLAVLLTLFVSVIILPFAWVLLSEYTILTQSYELPITAIGELSQGSTAKVSGTLSSPTQVAYGGHYRLESGYLWFWNTTDVFSITDSTGTVEIRTSRWWHVFPGPHLAPYVDLPSSGAVVMPTAYFRGDRAIIVGTLLTSEGAPVMDAFIIAPSNEALAPPALGLQLGSGILGVLGIGAVAIGVTAAWRRSRHRRIVASASSLEFESETSDPDTTSPWRTNPVPPHAGRRGVRIGAVGCAIGYSVLGWYFLAVHTHDEQLAGAGYLAIANMLAFTVVFFWAFRVPFPTAVAFSDDGVRLWFPNRTDRHLLVEVIPWKFLGEYEVRQRSIWTRTTEAEVDPVAYFSRRLRLSPDNRESLRAEWAVRKPFWIQAAQAEAAHGKR